MGNRERGSRKKKQRPDKMKVNLLNKKELRGFCPYFTIRLFYSFMILLLFFEGFKGFFDHCTVGIRVSQVVFFCKFCV